MGAVKHGGQAFFKRGIIGRGKRKLAAAVDGIIREYRADLGGETTTGQEVLLAQLRKCLLFQALVDSWLSRQPGGFVNEKGDIPAALSNFYLSILNSSCRIVDKLGLERKAQGESLEKYLEAKVRQGQDTQPAKPMMNDAPAGEIVDPGANGEGIPGGEA